MQNHNSHKYSDKKHNFYAKNNVNSNYSSKFATVIKNLN